MILCIYEIIFQIRNGEQIFMKIHYFALIHKNFGYFGKLKYHKFDKFFKLCVCIHIHSFSVCISAERIEVQCWSTKFSIFDIVFIKDVH